MLTLILRLPGQEGGAEAAPGPQQQQQQQQRQPPGGAQQQPGQQGSSGSGGVEERTAFVKYLPDGVTRADLEAVFGSCGALRDVRIGQDLQTGKSKVKPLPPRASACRHARMACLNFWALACCLMTSFPPGSTPHLYIPLPPSPGDRVLVMKASPQVHASMHA